MYVSECGNKIKRNVKLKRRKRKANDASQPFFRPKQGIDPCYVTSSQITPYALPLVQCCHSQFHLHPRAQHHGTAATLLPGRVARSMRVRHGAGGLRRQRADHDVPFVLRQRHGGLPVRAAPRVRPRGAPGPALLHQRRADAAPPLGLVPRPGRGLRVPRPDPARPGHVRLPRAGPLRRGPGQRLRGGALAGAVPGARPGQRVPPPRLPRHVPALPGLPRPPPPLPERVRDRVRRLLRLPRVGRLRRRQRPASLRRRVRSCRGNAARVLRGAVGRDPGGEREPARVRGVQQRVQPRARARARRGRRVGVRHPGVVDAAGGEPRVLRRVPRHGRGVRPRHGEPRRPVPVRGLELHLQLRLLGGRGAVGRRRRRALGRASLGCPRRRIDIAVVVRVDMK